MLDIREGGGEGEGITIFCQKILSRSNENLRREPFSGLQISGIEKFHA